MFNHVTCFVSAALFGLVFGMFFMRSRGSFARTRYVWLLFPFSQLVAVLIAIAYGYAANMPFGYFCFVAFLSAVCAAVDMFLLLALDLTTAKLAKFLCKIVMICQEPALFLFCPYMVCFVAQSCLKLREGT